MQASQQPLGVPARPLRAELQGNDRVVDVRQQRQRAWARAIQIGDHLRPQAPRALHGSQSLLGEVTIDQQQTVAVDHGEVEGRRPALELAAIWHEEAALAPAPLDEHHGDGRARVARTHDAPGLDAGGT